MLNRIMKDESGVLTFEWILLITLLVIGIVGGIAAIRDALIIEAGETAGAIVALDHSYVIADPLEVFLSNDISGSYYGENDGDSAILGWQSGDAEGSAFLDNGGTVQITTPDNGGGWNNDDAEATTGEIVLNP